LIKLLLSISILYVGINLVGTKCMDCINRYISLSVYYSQRPYRIIIKIFLFIFMTRIILYFEVSRNEYKVIIWRTLPSNNRLFFLGTFENTIIIILCRYIKFKLLVYILIKPLNALENITKSKRLPSCVFVGINIRLYLTVTIILHHSHYETKILNYHY